MRLIQFALSAGLILGTGFGSAHSFAQSASTNALNIEKFAVAKSVAATERSGTVERTAVLDGTQYAVIAPIFTDINTGNYSFIRFQNLISTASNFTVRVVGSPSGNVYGQTTISVAASASKHVQINDILAAASATTLVGGDTAYALYISNPDLSGYQHVIYNYVSKFFENASLCQTSLNQATVRYLPNVHTNIISDAGFPSKIYMHNYANQAVTYNVSVYEASTGSLVGVVPVATQANSTYVMDFSFFQNELGWTPAGAQGYANLIFTPQTAITGVTLPPVTVGHFIFNETFQAFVNMSESCAVNPGEASTASATNATTTTYAGTIAAVGGGSGTLTVNIPTGSSTASAPVATAGMTGNALTERTQATVTATGTLVLGSTTTSLTGTYNTTTMAVTLTGGGYSFGGSVSSGSFNGTYTGPAGASGSFSTLDTTSTLVTAYCGTYRDNPPDDFSGTFNITVSLKGIISGTFSGTAGSGRLSGTVTGNSVRVTKAGDPAIITGTISGTTISGTSLFNDGSGGSGTFTGQKCDLPAAS